MYLICVFYIIYFIIQLGTVFFYFFAFSYQRLGTKLLLGIMFKNEIIVLTVAVYSLYII